MHELLVSYFERGRAKSLRDQGAQTGAETWEKIAAICEEWERIDLRDQERKN